MRADQNDLLAHGELANVTADTSAAALLALARHLHLMNYAHGLKPAQWQALRYYAAADPAVATITAFAEADGITQPAASQTVFALVKRDLLTSTIDPIDRRIRRIAVTASGRRSLKRDPMAALAKVLVSIDPATLGVIDSVVTRLLAELSPDGAAST